MSTPLLCAVAVSRLLRIVPESYTPDTQAVLAHIKRTGEVPPGIEYIPGENRLSYNTNGDSNGEGAGRSIVVTGDSRHLLKPVIKVASAAVSGSLSGVVVPDSTNPIVLAITGTDTSSTFADTTGYFRFRYLSPATYLLSVVPADVTYRDTTLTNVVVAAAQLTNVGTIVLQQK